LLTESLIHVGRAVLAGSWTSRQNKDKYMGQKDEEKMDEFRIDMRAVMQKEGEPL